MLREKAFATRRKLGYLVRPLSRKLSVLLVVAFALAAVPAAFAEDNAARETAPPAAAPLAQPRITVVPSSKNDVSRPLRTVTPVFPSTARRATPENKPTPRLGAFAPKTLLSDPVVQASAAVGRMPATTQNFEGVANSDNVLDVIPPDTNGDVGPNHYVEWVNLAFSIYSKTGTRVYGPSAGSALWSGFGGVCESSNDGDPVVQYDSLAGRWLFSQLALPNYPSGPFYQCLAVSTSSDPTGSYYRYQYTFSNTVLNDYPKFGVWP